MGNTASNKGGSNRPLMRIHNVHGKSLRITQNRLLATRHDGYADALFFGSRPVVFDEQVEVTIKKMVKEWNGSIRFGFTTHDPVNIANHPEGIPRYMCPDLIKRGGSYVETISHISLRERDKIVFWVNRQGEVKFKINDTNQRCQLHGIVKDVWPVVDVYGNTTEVSFRSLLDDYDKSSESNEPRFYKSLKLTPFNMMGNNESVQIVDRYTAKRIGSRKVFSWNQSGLPVNTVWIVFIKEVDQNTGGTLSIAVMTNNPAEVDPLPDNLSGFQNPQRRGCSIYRDVYVKMQVGDEVAICILESGSVMVAINGEKFDELGRIVQNQYYWVVADLWCSVLSVTSVGVHQMSKYLLPKMPDVPIDSISEIPDDSVLGAVGGYDDKHVDDDFSCISETSTFEEVAEQIPPVPESNTQSLPPDLLASECVICLDQLPDTVFIPCGHVVCCNLCADNMMNEHGNVLCPTCRKRIEKNIKISFSKQKK